MPRPWRNRDGVADNHAPRLIRDMHLAFTLENVINLLRKRVMMSCRRAPDRNARLVIVTSENSTGSHPSALSRVSEAEAIPSRARCALPEKIISSVRLPRSVR